MEDFHSLLADGRLPHERFVALMAEIDASDPEDLKAMTRLTLFRDALAQDLEIEGGKAQQVYGEIMGTRAEPWDREKSVSGLTNRMIKIATPILGVTAGSFILAATEITQGDVKNGAYAVGALGALYLLACAAYVAHWYSTLDYQEREWNRGNDDLAAMKSAARNVADDHWQKRDILSAINEKLETSPIRETAERRAGEITQPAP